MLLHGGQRSSSWAHTDRQHKRCAVAHCIAPTGLADSVLACLQAQHCQYVGTWHEGNFIEGKWVYNDGSMFSGSLGEVTAQAANAEQVGAWQALRVCAGSATSCGGPHPVPCILQWSPGDGVGLNIVLNASAGLCARVGTVD